MMTHLQEPRLDVQRRRADARGYGAANLPGSNIGVPPGGQPRQSRQPARSAADGAAEACAGLRVHFIYNRCGKRALDVGLTLAAAIFLLPVVLIVAVLIKLEDGGPVFYSQPRVGRGGRVFRFWKFRSMVPDAKARLSEFLDADAGAAQEWELTQKLRRDPRITRTGGFIRKTSLDELPQLWNVLMGEMSLVGPRPMMPEQQRLYPGHEYYALRPGITGFWQVSCRNAASFADRAWYDARYAREVSLAADIRTMSRTIRVVIDCTGN